MTMSYNILFWHILGYFQFHPATWKHWFHLYIFGHAASRLLMQFRHKSWWSPNYRKSQRGEPVLIVASEMFGVFFCFTSLDSLQEQDTIQKLGAKCVDVFPMINDIYIYIYVCDIRVGVFVFGCLCGTSCCILHQIFRCLSECSSYKPRF